MKAAHFDYEMRLQLMGHTSSRPDYGEGFSLESLHERMEAMALPFNPAVV